MATTRESPKLSYTQVGDKGPKVLLIMGFGMRGDAWKPQVDGLGQACQLLFFDNRGVGKSDALEQSISMLGIAKDAARVLDAVGWDSKVHLVGVSMGGMVAQELALHQPERFQSLTLIATHAGGKANWLPRPKGIFRFLVTQFSSKKKRPKALAKLLYTKKFLASCDQLDLQKRMRLQIGDPAPKATLKRQLSAIVNHDTRDRLPNLRLPTLIVKPEKDILVNPKHSDHLQARIEHADTLKIPDAGHGITYQSADLLNQKLLQHFHSAEPQP